MFHNHGIPAKLIIMGEHPTAYIDLKQSNIPTKDVLMMADFARDESPEVNYSKATITRIPDHNQMSVQEHVNEDHFFVNQHPRMIVKYFDEKLDASIVPNQLEYVQQFNRTGELIAIDHYDSRGFKRRNQVYDATGTLSLETYFKTDETPSYYAVYADGKLQQITHLDFQGVSHLFYSERELASFLLEQINDENSKNHFLIDNPAENLPLLLNFSQPQRLIPIIRSQADRARVIQVLEDTKTVSFNKLIVNTDDEANWFETRFAVQTVPISPDGIKVTLRPPYLGWQQRYPGQVILMINQEDYHVFEKVVGVISILHSQYPQVRLTIFLSHREMDSKTRARMYEWMKNKVESLGIQAFIKLEKGTLLTTDQFNSAQLLLLAEMNQFNQTEVTTALATGLPLLVLKQRHIGSLATYGINIADEDMLAFTQQIQGILFDVQQWQGISQAERQTAESFYKLASWQLWQQVFNEGNDKTTLPVVEE